MFKADNQTKQKWKRKQREIRVTIVNSKANDSRTNSKPT